MKKLTLASWGCPSRRALPSVLRCHKEHQATGMGTQAQGWPRRISKASWWRAQSSATARGWEGCGRAVYSALARASEPPGGPLGGGACAVRPGCGPLRSRASGFRALPEALSAATSHVWDVAFGVGWPLGIGAATRLEEDCSVGRHRARSPQGCCLTGPLPQRPLRAVWWQQRGAAGCCTASPVSPARAGRLSEGL